jgi:glutamate carboxypeptidase
MPGSPAAAWVARHAPRMAASAERDLEALVAVSSPSGDARASEEALAVAAALAPPEAAVERIPSSSPGFADDMVARLRGSGGPNVLLLGHLDTVIPHPGHRPLARAGERLEGTGAVDMNGGVGLALGLLHALVDLSDAFAEVALLLVTDEEWRLGAFAHVERFAGFDACLCFEAGQLGPGGEEAVVVRRKAAGTLRVRAAGAAAHSGSAPDQGRNALLALAAAAQAVASCHQPGGPDRLTAVPTVLHAGDAFNVVPAAGELLCDLRADRLEAFDRVLAALPAEVGGAEVEATLLRSWPGMDSSAPTAPVLARASALLGRPVLAGGRGGASDASHFAPAIPLTIDGLGPRGGGAHTSAEHVLAPSLARRAEIALAVTAAVLRLP